jgi:hypothetical protein
VQAARVDARRAAGDDRGLGRDAQDDRKQLRAALGRVLLGVVQRPERADVAGRQALEVEQDRGRDERPRQAATSSLVGPGYVTNVERAVEGEQAATGRPGTLRPVGRLLRGIRSCRGASR